MVIKQFIQNGPSSPQVTNTNSNNNNNNSNSNININIGGVSVQPSVIIT